MNKNDFDIIDRSSLLKLFSSYYQKFGFNLTLIDSTINSKKNLISPNFTYKEPTFLLSDEMISNSIEWKKLSGIGALTGNNNIRCIDIDNCNNIDIIKWLLNSLKLPEDYEWVVRSGSNNGFHIWISVDKLSENYYLSEEGSETMNKFGFIVYKLNQIDNCKIELRWNCHVILPPSLYFTGNTYQFLNNEIPQKPPLKVNEDLLFDSLDKIGTCNEILPHFGHLECTSDEAYDPYILFIDVETTGLSKKQNSTDYKDLSIWPYIVQIGLIICNANNRRVLLKEDFILKPDGFSIPIESEKFHGISNEYALKNGIERKSVFKHLLEILKSVEYVVGHNISFDINVLKCEIMRNLGNNEFLFENTNISFQQEICTMKLSTDYCKLAPLLDNNYKYPTLSELYYKLFHNYYKGKHNATNDVLATLYCYWRMIDLDLIYMNPSMNCILNQWKQGYPLPPIENMSDIE